MNSTAQLLSPSEAARRLGISTKALRLYQERGLMKPMRTVAGWRAYGPEQMARAPLIVDTAGWAGLRRIEDITQAARTQG